MSNFSVENPIYLTKNVIIYSVRTLKGRRMKILTIFPRFGTLYTESLTGILLPYGVAVGVVSGN